MEENMSEKVSKEMKKQLEEQIENIMQEGIQVENINMLGKLVDIHKDLANEEYWNKKKEAMEMRYRDYGNYGNYEREPYGRGRRRDSRGRYMTHGTDGRHGEKMMNEMYNGYKRYSEGREQYGRGNYNAKEDTMKSLEYMLQSMVDFVEMLKEDASSQEEMELIREYTKEISEM